jgi:hypothetical protein
MRRTTYVLTGFAALALAAASGCSGDDGLGGIGGNLLGSFAQDQATKAVTGGAQQQAEQQAAARQAGAGQPGAASQVPAMDLAGTLVEKQSADGQSLGWTFMQDGSGIGMPVDVTRVESDARSLAGKRVILTGRYDSTGAGDPKLVAERLAVAGQ